MIDSGQLEQCVLDRVEYNMRDRIFKPGLCLYYAHEAASALHKLGLWPVIQAGSMQWPRIKRCEDDGKINTHFAYMWSPNDAASALSRAFGNLPEMHVWVGLVDSQTLIDFSTRHIKAAAKNAGMDWTADDPPKYLWAGINEMPEWVVYRPNRAATLTACSILNSLFNPAYLRRA